jgi:hypothetical protein
MLDKQLRYYFHRWKCQHLSLACNAQALAIITLQCMLLLDVSSVVIKESAVWCKIIKYPRRSSSYYQCETLIKNLLEHFWPFILNMQSSIIKMRQKCHINFHMILLHKLTFRSYQGFCVAILGNQMILL